MEEFGKKAGPGVSTVSQRDQYMTSMLGAVAQVSPASTVKHLWQPWLRWHCQMQTQDITLP